MTGRRGLVFGGGRLLYQRCRFWEVAFGIQRGRLGACGRQAMMIGSLLSMSFGGLFDFGFSVGGLLYRSELQTVYEPELHVNMFSSVSSGHKRLLSAPVVLTHHSGTE